MATRVASRGIKDESHRNEIGRGTTVEEVVDQLGIWNKTQIRTWMRWYRKGELHRLEQPVGKQYSYGRGPEHTTDLEKVKAENRFLKQQLDLLKKYKELEKRWKQKSLSPGSSLFVKKWPYLKLVHSLELPE